MYFWLAVTLLAAFGIFAPSLFGMDGMNGGYAISFFCILIAITGFVVVIMYRGRARVLDGIFRGEGLLAHWKYTPESWREFSEKDYKLERQAKWGLYRLVMVITAVVCAVFFLFHRDSGILMIGIFLGLGALLAFVIQFTTSYDHWQSRRNAGESFIARSGAYVGRKLHIWQGWGASMDGARYHEHEGFLEFTYSMPSRTGRDTAAVRVPVPPGKEEEARQVLQALANGHGA